MTVEGLSVFAGQHTLAYDTSGKVFSLRGCRLEGLPFEIAASAGWYSAIAGLLAGFAFVAVLLPLDHESSEGDDTQTGHAVVAFVSAFFSLLTVSIAYAVLAGRTGEGEVTAVAAHEQMLVGAAFGLSTLLLLLGLRGVLRSYGANRRVFSSAQGVIVAVTAVLGPLMVVGLQFSNALDLQRYRVVTGAADEQCGPGGLPIGVLVNLGIVALAAAAILGLLLVRDRITRREAAVDRLAWLCLVSTVLVVLWSAVILPLLPVSAVASPLLEHTILAATSLLAVVFAAGSWSSR